MAKTIREFPLYRDKDRNTLGWVITETESGGVPRAWWRIWGILPDARKFYGYEKRDKELVIPEALT